MAKSFLRCVGLMSGTSMDGIDAALIETDGEGHSRFLASHHQPYDEGFRAALRAGMKLAQGLSAPAPGSEPFGALERELTRRHGDAVAALLAGEEADVIGFHGQTLVHRPQQGWTWQIGDGAMLAAATGTAVVHDLRSADVAAGGQGAPLLPIYHQALVAGHDRPLAVLNLGGVGNVSWIGADAASLMAFDTGPGNALIDDWMMEQAGAPCDTGGAVAARGSVHRSVLDGMLDLDWFDAPPPKSLDRDDFSTAACRGLSLEDGAATLTAFTAQTVALAARHLPQPPRRWIVVGGGRHNDTLMAMLGNALRAPLINSDILGWRGDSIEAEGFAYMAARHLKGLPISFPGTTGAPQPMTGGRLAKV
jgi:anhydro-N-acetylmuramic acid kinase